jgi:hypothetical protein
LFEDLIGDEKVLTVDMLKEWDEINEMIEGNIYIYTWIWIGIDKDILIHTYKYIYIHVHIYIHTYIHT